LLLALCIGSVRSQAADVLWINPAGGNWSNTNNWSAGRIPGVTDDAFITTDGTYAVVLDTNASFARLTLGAAVGTQTLVITNRTLSLSSSSVVNPNGVLELGGGALNGAGDLTVQSLLRWTGGALSSGINIATNGVLNISGAASKSLGGTIRNEGVINWSADDFRKWIDPQPGGWIVRCSSA
jgi:hypothetical protein